MRLVAGGYPPEENITAEQWIQRMGVIAESIDEATKLLFQALNTYAPILLQPGNPVGVALTGIIISVGGVRQSATTWMGRHGIAPLTLRDEKVRIARDALADPATTDHMREHFLDLLAQALAEEPETPPAAAPDTEDTEWPGVIGGGE